MMYVYKIIFSGYILCTQNEDNVGHKICRGPDDSVLKQFIIYRRRGGNESNVSTVYMNYMIFLM